MQKRRVANTAWSTAGCATVDLNDVVLAAQALGPLAEACVLDRTFLADRATTVRQHLARDPTIMAELPPEALRVRYGG